jgi:hypothetical protein
MKKPDHKKQRGVQARTALRALRLQELLFGGGAASPVAPTSGAPLGTSLPLATGTGGEGKWPYSLGE